MPRGELLAWSLGRAREQTLALVADVPDESMRLQSRPGERHPGWLLGHLLLADVYLLHLLAVEPLSDPFQILLERYGPRSEPSAHPPFDSKRDLVERLSRTHSLRLARVQEMTDRDLAQPMTDTFLARAQPTIGHHLCSLVFHEGYHAGQLSSWRRAHRLSAVSWMFGPAREDPS